MSHYYNSLMGEPSGGNPLYDNPFDSWGMIGMDIGLGLFAHKASMIMGGLVKKSQMRGARSAYKARRAAILDEFRHPTGYGPPTPPGSMRKGMRHTQLTAARHDVRKVAVSQKRDTLRSYDKAGRTFARLGLTVAALSLVDMGFRLFNTVSTAGVSRETLESDRRTVFGNEMLDTQAAYTQRQRSLQAIHDSQMTVGRALLGQEASYVHR